MYNVLDVCRYIINYSNDKNYGISNLKLQKILYFVQAYFLACTDEHKPCFEERIEAWDFGPVVPDAYYEYKQYGSADIPKITSCIRFNPKNIWDSEVVDYNDNIISPKDRENINKTVDKFSDYTATTLVTITHHQAPWKDAYCQGQNNIITHEAIRRYFING